jgi:hypothetical protein
VSKVLIELPKALTLGRHVETCEPLSDLTFGQTRDVSGWEGPRKLLAHDFQAIS